MSSLKILVTGASGFIGSKVSRILAETLPDSSVIGIGRKKMPSNAPDFPNYEYFSCDLLENSLNNSLPGEVDVVMHLAGDRRTFVKPDDYTPQTYSNIVLTSNMADYAYSAKAKLFIYASSVYVYSGNTDPPFLEDSVAIPRENLGATKLASESLLKARAYAGQFKALSFRIGTVYGPGSSQGQFIPQAIEQLSSADPVAKFGSGDVKRDFIFIDDVAQAFAAGIRSLDRNVTYDAFNIGTNTQTSISEVVQILVDLIGTKKQIEFTASDKAGNDADTDHQLDIKKIGSFLGWQPHVTLHEGFSRTIESLNST